MRHPQRLVGQACGADLWGRNSEVSSRLWGRLVGVTSRGLWGRLVVQSCRRQTHAWLLTALCKDVGAVAASKACRAGSVEQARGAALPVTDRRAVAHRDAHRCVRSLFELQVVASDSGVLPGILR